MLKHEGPGRPALMVFRWSLLFLVFNLYGGPTLSLPHQAPPPPSYSQRHGDAAIEGTNRQNTQAPLSCPTTMARFYQPLLPPDPPSTLPLRFLRAGKNDSIEGWRRYRATLQWRQEERLDTILREAFPFFSLIKHHYPHFYHGRGRRNEPVFYEMPARANLPALRRAGVTVEQMLRHYTLVTEFQWQVLEPNDLAKSITVIDLVGIRLGDFVGDTVRFVKAASRMTAQHFPERAGCVFLLHVPAWFRVIWSVVRPLIDETTLQKIYILRGEEEIRTSLLQRIAPEQIPKEYGGSSPYPLGQSPEELMLRDLMEHNNALARQGRAICQSCQDLKHEDWPCSICKWTPVRSY